MTEKPNISEKFDRTISEHRALAILRILDRSPGYRVNSSVLLDWLRTIALVATRAELNDTISSLERFGLINTERVEDLIVLELRERGHDVACGRVFEDGVLRPDPDCPY